MTTHKTIRIDLPSDEARALIAILEGGDKADWPAQTPWALARLKVAMTHGDPPSDLPTPPRALRGSPSLVAAAVFALIAFGVLMLGSAANEALSVWSYFAFGYGELH